VNVSGWRDVRLGDVCTYSTSKVSVTEINEDNYISTENMLPNKSGIVKSSGLPTVASVTRYFAGNVLVSNIRPYFKKIWYADRDGGCSNDVLVFDIKDKGILSSRFLFYCLSNDDFFNYVMAGAKGTKMPRGDKGTILKYPVRLPPIPEQKAIAATLSALDDMIELNNQINKTLEEMAQAIFKSWFVDFEPFKDGEFEESELGLIPKGWKVGMLGDFVEVVDNRGKTPPLSDVKTEYPIIDVRALSGESRVIDYNNCTKYVEKEIYDSWFRNGHPKQLDILISTVGSISEMKMFYGNKGCIAQNVVAFRSNGISPFYLYQYLQYSKGDLLSYNIGSVQPSIKVTHVIKYKIIVPDEKTMSSFDMLIESISDQIYRNANESQILIAIRDTLLPKLMSGEIRVPVEEVV
jgi:type I restriction enzyme S subunit